MRGTYTPPVAVGKTTEELIIRFGPTGASELMRHNVIVPAGTRCHKLDDPQGWRWVVADLSWLKDRGSFLYWDADHFGIPVPADKIEEVKNGR